MRIKFSLRLTSPILGDVRQQRPPLTFNRHPQNPAALKLDLKYWGWAWQVALSEEAPLDVYRACVRMDQYTVMPTLTIFERRFQNGSAPGVCIHESIRGGAIVSFTASVVTPDPSEPSSQQEMRVPSTDELYRALKRIGETLGISPWGSKHGYGRFIIAELEINGSTYSAPVGREPADNNAGSARPDAAADDRCQGDAAAQDEALDPQNGETSQADVHIAGSTAEN